MIQGRRPRDAGLKAFIAGALLALGCGIGQSGFAAQNSRSSTPQVTPPAPVYSNSVQDAFGRAAQIVFSRLQSSYDEAMDEHPLRIAMVSTSDPILTKIDGATGLVRESGGGGLAVSFEPTLVLGAEEKGVPTCLVRYNEDRRVDQTLGFELLDLFSRRDILYYLVVHEFGHCMAFHQARLGLSPDLDASQHELVADEVAAAFFIVNHQPNVAAKLALANQRVTDKVHYHPLALARFVRGLTERSKSNPTLGVRNMLDVYRLVVNDAANSSFEKRR